MSRIVVTGAGGFVGRHLLPLLAARGHDVLALDRRAGGASVPGIRHRQSDLGGPEPLPRSELVAGEGVTLVHLAWNMRRDGGRASQQEQVDFLMNVLARHEAEIERVVLIGSAEEYGRRAGRLAEEDAPVEPLSDYGAAKRDARLKAAAWAERCGVPVVWLRPFIVYGEGQGGDMVIPYALRCAREKQRGEFTDGSQQRDFIHVDDVAAAIVCAAEAATQGFLPVNVGTGEAVRVADVLALLAARLDAKELFVMGARPRRPGEPDVQVADGSRAARVFNWRARIGWHDGIAALAS